MKRPGSLRLSAAGVALLATASCGGAATKARPGTVTTAGVTLPSQILGLHLRAEDVSKGLAETRRPFLSNLGLFSLREGELVRATLQVSRFNRLARPKDPDFRASIIELLGSRRPLPVRVGDDTVYVTTGTEQSIFAWFDGRGFFVLTTHRDYEFPRTLLRRLLSYEQEL